ncbi:MAG TPA: hypothetical protein VLW84_14195, partial [Terriglobales bacterium]|nr:hypothetical protein [Terriglobales bacterium]
GYERFDVGAVGELDVAVLLDQYADIPTSRALYPHWRGGYYYAVRPKGEAAGPLGLLYVSRWSSSEKAADFAAIYAKALTQRYKQLHGEAALPALSGLESLTGKHVWQTEEGRVVIDVEGTLMLVTESLDQPITDKLEREVFGVAATAGH